MRPLLQLSLTEAEPKAAATSAAVGLQPSDVAAASVITGGVVSSVQVTVRVAVPVLPQASVELKVRVCERVQPLLLTALSEADTVTGPQLSVAVALPRAASLAAAVGLQPRVKVVPVAVTTGLVVSSVQVTIRLA